MLIPMYTAFLEVFSRVVVKKKTFVNQSQSLNDRKEMEMYYAVRNGPVVCV
jgi:hypothetical protein